MTPTYTTKEASELLGASRPAIRVYTSRYARYMSTEATPDAGTERRFTEADLRLMAYIYQQTKAGKSHDTVLEALANGALDAFDWQPPTTTHDIPTDAGSIGTALVPIERLVATQALLQAERDEHQRLLDRELELTERLERTRQELGEALGELKAIKATRRKPPAWWVKIFGGGE